MVGFLVHISFAFLYALNKFDVFVATGLILGIVIPTVVVLALIGLYVFRSKLPTLKR